MTTPEIPPPRPVRRKAPVAIATQSISLTPAEAQLLQAFRTINDRQQQNMVRAMKSAAQRFPRIARPALRLITGGTK